jgi:hypothetical protein
MRARNPFSTRLEGPRTAADIAVEQKWRASQNKPERKETPPGFERILTLKDVVDHFQSQSPKAGREDLCHYPFKCDVWKVERSLLDDMDAVSDLAETQRLRGLIRAASWMTHDRPASSSLMLRARLMQERFETKRNELARTDEAEAKEWEEEIAMATRIVEALQRQISGEALEPAVHAFETLYRRSLHDYENAMRLGKQVPKKMVELAKTEVESLRPLRDELYFRRLYPRWFNAGTATSRPAPSGS